MIRRFLLTTRLGRGLLIAVHRWPLHPNWNYPLRFWSRGCWLCRYVAVEFEQGYPDRSTVSLSEPEYDESGTLVRHGVRATASMKRQLDELALTDPDAAKRVREAIERISRDP